MSAVYVVIASLISTAFFSAAEMAFIAANRIRLRHLAESGHEIAARYLEAFKKPELLLSAAKMGVPLAHIIASTVATSAMIPTFGPLAALIVTLTLTPVMLIVGEVIPKAIAQQWATGLILRLYRPLSWAAKLLWPLTWTAGKIVGGVLRLLGQSPENFRQFVSREELKLVLQTEPEESDVTTHEAEMIDNIFSLSETAVSEVMVPLADVVMLTDTAPPEEAIKVIHERGFSRIPVHSGQASNIGGVVTAMDLFRRGGAVPMLKDLMRPVTYVPEAKRIDDLLTEMQKARIQLAVVVNEYGESVGIVTLEDIIEEIVGRIEDEHDRRPTGVERLPDGSYLISGRLAIDDLNEELGLELPKAESDYETLGGLVLARLNRIPRPGEEIDIGQYHLTVVDADARRVLKVKVSPKKARPAERA